MASNEKLDSLLQRKAALEKQIASLEAKQKAQKRKDENRLKILIGAAMLADAKINDETAVLILEVLERAITTERDRAFLQSKNWLKPDEKAGQ